MNLSERKLILVKLGEILKDLESYEMEQLFYKAETENPWFTIRNIKDAVDAIRDQYLSSDALQRLIDIYHLDDNIVSRKIGLILAGNIPLVGIHDVICCFLCGHISLLKYSDKDKVLMKWFIDKIKTIEPISSSYFEEVDKLKDYEAAIATGSNASAVHFEYYFRHVPHIIRRNRNSVAVLTGDESDEQLTLLGADVFSYFGLGCRNVSMILVPKTFDIERLIKAFEPYKDIIHHHKYKNNYDYNLALMLLNKETFLQSDFLIFKESDQIISRIASIHYKYYLDQSDLTQWLNARKEEIQCVVSSIQINDINTVSIGEAQCPTIHDFADGVDTMAFLLSF